MIDQEFLKLTEKGLYCKTGDFYLDPSSPVNHAVVSHAHGDHACTGNLNCYCTSATKAIMQLRYAKNAGKNFYTNTGPFYINNIELEFFPAGHILGSAMVLLTYKGIKYLYTGDYKLQPDSTCEAAILPEADVLITESTFANPSVKHPDPVEEIKKLNHINSNILLGAYSLGKAQRLNYLISEYCPEKRVLLHYSVLPIHKLYEQFNFTPGKYEVYNRKLMKLPQKNFIYMVPPFTFDSYFRAKDVVKIFASGWAGLQKQNQEKLFISDHVDWNDILFTIEKVKPQEIWTLHGDGSALADFYKNDLPVKILN